MGEGGVGVMGDEWRGGLREWDGMGEGGAGMKDDRNYERDEERGGVGGCVCVHPVSSISIIHPIFSVTLIQSNPSSPSSLKPTKPITQSLIITTSLIYFIALSITLIAPVSSCRGCFTFFRFCLCVCNCECVRGEG
jgi:hypothetical protein